MILGLKSQEANARVGQGQGYTSSLHMYTNVQTHAQSSFQLQFKQGKHRSHLYVANGVKVMVCK